MRTAQRNYIIQTANSIEINLSVCHSHICDTAQIGPTHNTMLM